MRKGSSSIEIFHSDRTNPSGWSVQQEETFVAETIDQLITVHARKDWMTAQVLRQWMNQERWAAYALMKMNR